ncbi:MAG: OmpA family protein [Bacteroidetes bacterium]|nr:OmpA family protein [Bacteroidota bacterium]
MKKLLVLGLAFAIAIPAMAQKKKSTTPNKDAKRWMVGAQVGGTTLIGDAQKLGFSYAAGVRAQYSFSHTIGFRVMGNYGQLKGSEKPDGRPYSSYSFTNNFWEAQGQVVITIGNISYLRKARKWNYYAAGGVGFFGSNAKSKYILKSDLTGTERSQTYNQVTQMYTASFGTRYNMNSNIAIGLEYQMRFVGSDLLDVLQYPSFGNKANDMVNMLQVTIDFKLGKKGKKHVDWINPVEAIYEDIAKVEKKVDQLSGDQDGDGVSDYFDKDNTTPQGAMVYGNGQAVDTDGDGVPDVKDQEPNSPKGAVVDENGKAADDDHDGVPNVLDLSPNTDTSYMVNHQGIPIMTKDLARKLAPKGGLGAGSVGYMPAILFETGSTQIKPIHYIDLQNIAEAIKRTQGVQFLIIGNADYRGSEKLNEKLALERAQAVKNVLIESFGVDPSRIEIQSNGEKVPIAKGTDPMSLQANRRVQFFIVE